MTDHRLGKKIEPAKPKAPTKGWRPHKPGFEIGPDDKLRTADINTTAEDYLRALARRSAP